MIDSDKSTDDKSDQDQENNTLQDVPANYYYDDATQYRIYDSDEDDDSELETEVSDDGQ